MIPRVEQGPRVAAAIRDGVPVVALESTLIAHGLPWPTNLETARAAEAAILDEGAVPATVGIWQGRPIIGMDAGQIEHMARAADIRKASRRDLAHAIIAGACAATTVAATMALAHMAGIQVFATGGIGGVHRRPKGQPSDISADLFELSRTPVAVVCAGAKSILDIPATLELLETLGVPVVGYGTPDFPAFYLASSGQPVSARADCPEQLAELVRTHWALGGAGVVVAQPLRSEEALDPRLFAAALGQAESDAHNKNVAGPALTPFLLGRLAELTGGRTLRANQALIIANARLAAHLAHCLGGGR
jgi:pseudouridine-5'-phosphate glycosidase